MKEPEGVLDQQNLVNNIVGLDFDTWRMCVYLGQGISPDVLAVDNLQLASQRYDAGAVSNFVTDADKRRKELLSRALNLGEFALFPRFTGRMDPS